MTNTRLRQALGAAALASACALAACVGESPEELVASAKASLATGDTRAAAIQLKTALQKTPDAPEVRFLLGRALLEGEEPGLAIVELRKALELRHPRGEVVPMLAEAMLQRGQLREAAAEFGTASLDDKAALARLKTTLGSIYLGLGQAAQAQAAYEAALAAAPGNVPALVAQARLSAMQGRREAAARAVDALIAAGNADAQAWLLKGDLLAGEPAGADAAIAAYRKSVELSNKLTAAHAGIIVLLTHKRDMKGATAQVAELLKVRPDHPVGRYFQAQLAYESGDAKAAKDIVLDLLKRAPDHPLYNQLAGAIDLAEGSLEGARSHLSKAVQAMPGNPVARRLLASAQLRAGEAPKALALLEPMVTGPNPDATVLALAGEAYLQLGDLDRASAMFAGAAKADPTAMNQTAVARARLLKGDATGAIADLQQIASSDAGPTADLELVSAHLRRRDFKAALTAIDALDPKMPKRALPAHLRAIAHLGLKDAAQARANFDKALSIEPTYYPAAAGAAALDVNERKLDLAQQRFETLLKAQPGHLQAMLALANVRARNGASKNEIADLLGNAVRLNPNQVSAHLALINHHLANKDGAAALAAAQRADAALPGQPAVLDALGSAQVAAGQANQAIATFNRLATMRPNDARAQMRLAEANLASKDTAAAIQSLQRAVEVRPDVPTVLRLFALLMNSERFNEALALGRSIQKRQPGSSLGDLLEGDALRALKNEEGAMTAYRRGTTKTPGVAAAVKIHKVLMARGKAAEAAQFAQTWAKQHPNDAAFTFYLGDAALESGDLAAAETHFRRVVELQGNHVVALNNLAWILAKTNKPGAVAMAEKANDLQPNQPPLMDTLAFALAADKQLDKALALQKKALALAPESPTLRLGMARLHVQAGQKAQARQLLEPLELMGDKFRDQAEVKRLLAAL
ncbi:MAG TPA: XrtA/PEP-CTERM system TPR-repeat protein PrsT [Burkholderiaceae bacterium]|nr:XrtA/PEP-CTERM system TPR-repeat protein PrsT [Burkholderiaceae bacterium]